MIRLLRRCHLPLLAIASFAQPIVLMLCRIAPENAAHMALFPVLTAVMLMLCARISGRMRPILLGGCCAVLFLAARVLLFPGASAHLLPLGCAGILLFAIAQADKDPAQASPMLYFACTFAQLASLFLLYQADESVRSMALMQGAFYLWLLLFLLTFNRISLNNATLSRYRLSAGMARTGVVLTLCVFALALILCAMPAVVSGINWLFGALREGSILLLMFVIHLFPAESTGGSAGAAMPLPLEGGLAAEAEASRFAQLLEKIAAVFSVLVLIIGCAILLRLLWLAVLRLVRHLLAHLARYAAAVTEDYEDEITDTREETGERAFLPLRHRTRQTNSYPDTPAGRIRRRYAQLLTRHGEWPPSSTARENLSSSAASLYEQARYSEHVPSQEDAQRFERETK